MSTADSTPQPLDPLAGVLSYLVPGLGQVIQGRVGKGLLFFFCIYGLFFYGMAMGQMKNVWIPDATDLPEARVGLAGRDFGELTGLAKGVFYRPQFMAQFWVGVAAWPALIQYRNSVDTPDGPAEHPWFGRYMQAPTEAELNTLQRNGNKRWDLAWVYTVVAGVLCILVIYDAVAGPVVRDETGQADKPNDSNKPRPNEAPAA